jgi:hypothetical protein
MVPWTGSAPRRARHLIPTDLPRRREVVAACAVAIVVAHLLLAQLTLLLAVLFAVAGKASRWRLWWLLGPAAAGLAWTLALGPDQALAGFTAGPSGLLWHLRGGHLAGQAGQAQAWFGNARSWLPRQLPVALVCGAAEAALAGWLGWLHTDEWAVPPPRPGLIAAVRRVLSGNAVRAGAVVTRDGCALGIVPSTGAVAELRWAELAPGALVTGAAARDVTLTGLQVVHAALRRRKPVIVFDFGDAVIARAVTAACAATGVPLLPGRPAAAAAPAGHALQVAGGPGASGLWGRGAAHERAAPAPAAAADGPGADLGRVVRDRAAMLLPADSAERAAAACAGLCSLAADLRRIGVDGDALIWVPHGERVPAHAIGPLLGDGQAAGLSVLIGTTAPAAAAELSELTGTTLSFRVTDRDLAARLAARSGTRLVPAPVAAVLAGERGQPDGAGPGPAVPVPGLVPSPVLPVTALLALGPGEFACAARSSLRVIAAARLVPARLPGSPR